MDPHAFPGGINLNDDRILPVGLVVPAGLWKQADYYELEAESTFWGQGALLVTLSQSAVPEPTTAFLCLLQRVLIGSRILDKSEEDLPAAELWVEVRASGLVDNPEPAFISPEIFRQSYRQVAGGILKEEHSALLHNGRPIPRDTILLPQEIRTVTAFADDWKRCQYFVETDELWLYFDWMAPE